MFGIFLPLFLIFIFNLIRGKLKFHFFFSTKTPSIVHFSLYSLAVQLWLNLRLGGFLLNISRSGRYILVIVGIPCHFQLILISVNSSIPNYFHFVLFLFFSFVIQFYVQYLGLDCSSSSWQQWISFEEKSWFICRSVIFKHLNLELYLVIFIEALSELLLHF